MRRFALIFAIACAYSGVAAAQAPITYAGRNAPPTQAPVQTASLELTGGGENSYGYGAQSRSHGGAVIDIRRPAAASTEPARAEVSAPSQAPSAPEASASEQGERPGWLEQERVGPPYQANGRWYVPTPEPGYEQTGTASWYGPQFHGQRAANGEVFDQEGLTAAHPTLPLNSLVQVTNLANGREVIVRITDRGPFVGERLIDLSHGAAVALDFERAGRTQVHVRYLGPAPRRYDASGTPAPVEPGDEPASLLPMAEGREREPLPSASAIPAASGAYFVQVGAFSDLDNAHRVQAAIGAAGPALVDVRQGASGELFRVRIGPLASLEAAENTQRSLASLGYGESIIAGR